MKLKLIGILIIVLILFFFFLLKTKSKNENFSSRGISFENKLNFNNLIIPNFHPDLLTQSKLINVVNDTIGYNINFKFNIFDNKLSKINVNENGNPFKTVFMNIKKNYGDTRTINISKIGEINETNNTYERNNELIDIDTDYSILIEYMDTTQNVRYLTFKVDNFNNSIDDSYGNLSKIIKKVKDELLLDKSPSAKEICNMYDDIVWCDLPENIESITHGIDSNGNKTGINTINILNNSNAKGIMNKDFYQTDSNNPTKLFRISNLKPDQNNNINNNNVFSIKTFTKAAAEGKYEIKTNKTFDMTISNIDYSNFTLSKAYKLDKTKKSFTGVFTYTDFENDRIIINNEDRAYSTAVKTQVAKLDFVLLKIFGENIPILADIKKDIDKNNYVTLNLIDFKNTKFGKDKIRKLYTNKQIEYTLHFLTDVIPNSINNIFNNNSFILDSDLELNSAAINQNKYEKIPITFPRDKNLDPGDECISQIIFNNKGTKTHKIIKMIINSKTNQREFRADIYIEDIKTAESLSIKASGVSNKIEKDKHFIFIKKLSTKSVLNSIPNPADIIYYDSLHSDNSFICYKNIISNIDHINIIEITFGIKLIFQIQKINTKLYLRIIPITADDQATTTNNLNNGYKLKKNYTYGTSTIGIDKLLNTNDILLDATDTTRNKTVDDIPIELSKTYNFQVCLRLRKKSRDKYIIDGNEGLTIEYNEGNTSKKLLIKNTIINGNMEVGFKPFYKYQLADTKNKYFIPSSYVEENNILIGQLSLQNKTTGGTGKFETLKFDNFETDNYISIKEINWKPYNSCKKNLNNYLLKNVLRDEIDISHKMKIDMLNLENFRYTFDNHRFSLLQKDKRINKYSVDEGSKEEEILNTILLNNKRGIYDLKKQSIDASVSDFQIKKYEDILNNINNIFETIIKKSLYIDDENTFYNRMMLKDPYKEVDYGKYKNKANTNSENVGQGHSGGYLLDRKGLPLKYDKISKYLITKIGQDAKSNNDLSVLLIEINKKLGGSSQKVDAPMIKITQLFSIKKYLEEHYYGTPIDYLNAVKYTFDTNHPPQQGTELNKIKGLLETEAAQTKIKKEYFLIDLKNYVDKDFKEHIYYVNDDKKISKFKNITNINNVNDARLFKEIFASDKNPLKVNINKLKVIEDTIALKKAELNYIVFILELELFVSKFLYTKYTLFEYASGNLSAKKDGSPGINLVDLIKTHYKNKFTFDTLTTGLLNLYSIIIEIEKSEKTLTELEPLYIANKVKLQGHVNFLQIDSVKKILADTKLEFFLSDNKIAANKILIDTGNGKAGAAIFKEGHEFIIETFNTQNLKRKRKTTGWQENDNYFSTLQKKGLPIDNKNDIVKNLYDFANSFTDLVKTKEDLKQFYIESIKGSSAIWKKNSGSYSIKQKETIARNLSLVNRTRSIYDNITVSLLCKDKYTNEITIIVMNINFETINFEMEETYNVELHRTYQNKNFAFSEVNINNEIIQLPTDKLPFEKTYYENIVLKIVEKELGYNILYVNVYDGAFKIKNKNDTFDETTGKITLDISKITDQTDILMYETITRYIKDGKNDNIIFNFKDLTYNQLKSLMNIKLNVEPYKPGRTIEQPKFLIFNIHKLVGYTELLKEPKSTPTPDKQQINLSDLYEDGLLNLPNKELSLFLLRAMNNIDSSSTVNCSSWSLGMSKIKKITNESCRNISYFMRIKEEKITSYIYKGKEISKSDYEKKAYRSDKDIIKTLLKFKVTTLGLDGEYIDAKEEISEIYPHFYLNDKAEICYITKNLEERTYRGELIAEKLKDIQLFIKVYTDTGLETDKGGIKDRTSTSKIKLPDNYLPKEQISHLNSLLLNKLKDPTLINDLKTVIISKTKSYILTYGGLIYIYIMSYYLNDDNYNKFTIKTEINEILKHIYNEIFFKKIVNVINENDINNIINSPEGIITKAGDDKYTLEIFDSSNNNKLNKNYDQIKGGITVAPAKLATFISNIKKLLGGLITNFVMANKNLILLTIYLTKILDRKKLIGSVDYWDAKYTIEKLKKFSVGNGNGDLTKANIDAYNNIECNLLPDIVKLHVIVSKTGTGANAKITDVSLKKLINADEKDIKLGQKQECINKFNVKVLDDQDDYKNLISGPIESFANMEEGATEMINLGGLNLKTTNNDAFNESVKNLKASSKSNMCFKDTGETTVDEKLKKLQICNSPLVHYSKKLEDQIKKLAAEILTISTTLTTNTTNMSQLSGNLVILNNTLGNYNTRLGTLTTSVNGFKDEVIKKISAAQNKILKSINPAISESEERIKRSLTENINNAVSNAREGIIFEIKQLAPGISANNNLLQELVSRLGLITNELKKFDCIKDGSCPVSSEERSMRESIKKISTLVEQNLDPRTGTLPGKIKSQISNLFTESGLKEAIDKLNNDEKGLLKISENVKAVNVLLTKMDGSVAKTTDMTTKINELKLEIARSKKGINLINRIIGDNNIIMSGKEAPGGSGSITETELARLNQQRATKTQMKEINDKLLTVLEQMSSGFMTATNRSEIDRQMRLMNGMIDVLKKKEGASDNVTFLQKLLLTSQMQMNKMMNNISRKDNFTNHEHDFNKSLQTPHLPTITQFKPEGTSNIFSPLIDIKTNSKEDNKKFMDAFERGFDKGMGETGNSKKRASIDMSKTYIDDKDTYNVQGDNDDNYQQRPRQRQRTNQYQNQNQNQNQNSQFGNEENNYKPFNQNVRTQQQYGTSEQILQNKGVIPGPSYIDSNNSNNNNLMGIPGYSYLDPKFFNMPQRRAPVCIETQSAKRHENSADPAGYMWGGHSDVMEFQSVGSILPKFQYNENTQNVPDKTNRI